MAARTPRLAKLLLLPTTPQVSVRNSFRANRIVFSKSIKSPASVSPNLEALYRSYSTQPPSNKTTPKNPENATEHNDDMPDVLAGLRSIKMGRTTKIIVYTALTIMATMESVFWMKVLWAKFGPAPKDLEDGQEEK